MWRSSRRSYEGALCALVFAVAVIVGGCGGSTPKADPKADKEAAKAATLIKSDLPGFIPVPYKASADDMTPSEERRLAKCLHVQEAAFLSDDTPDGQVAHSPTFKRDNLSIDSEIEIDSNSKSIDAGFDMLDSGRFEDCLAAFLTTSLADAAKKNPGAKVGAPTVSRTRPDLGDLAERFLGDVSFSAPGVSATEHFEVLFIKKGRAVVTIESNDFAPIYTDRSEQLATTILNRLRDHT